MRMIPFILCLASTCLYGTVEEPNDGPLAIAKSIQPPMSCPSASAFIPGTQYAIIADLVGNSLNVFDGNLSLIQTIPTGNTPNAVAISPDKKMVVVANKFDDHLSVYSLSPTGKLTALAPLSTGKDPTGCAFSNDGKILVVSNQQDNNLAVYKVDTSSQAFTLVQTVTTAIGPGALAFSPDNTMLGVVCSASVCIYSNPSGAGPFSLYQAIDQNAYSPVTILFPRSDTLLVGNLAPPNLNVYQQTGTFQLTQSLNWGNFCLSLAYTPVSGLVVAGCGSLLAIDVKPGKCTRLQTIQGPYQGLSFTSDGQNLIGGICPDFPVLSLFRVAF